MKCRFCGEPLSHPFVDLGMSPLSNAYRRPDDLERMEAFYPLTVYVCASCFLVQLPAFETPEAIFSDYAYFSSYSDTLLEHARDYCARMTERLALGASSRVIEIASNDGYLLQYFRAGGIPVLGIEPAANVAAAASRKGIETLTRFFGAAMATELAETGRKADLLIGNNVLAHVPDINDFVEGMRIVLGEKGTITIELPHLMRMMIGNQFDTIYFEHFSYLSLLTVRRIFAAHALTVFDVDEIPTHGGSLRIYARHAAAAGDVDPRVDDLERREREYGLDRIETYGRFADQVERTKRALLRFLIEAKESGKQVVGYGAPAKAATLLNYCGVGTDLLEFTVDRSPHKQGLYLPGARIPIHAPEKIAETKPDYVLILPWNLREEITRQMAHVREWGGKFVVPIPSVEVLE